MQADKITSFVRSFGCIPIGLVLHDLVVVNKSKWCNQYIAHQIFVVSIVVPLAFFQSPVLTLLNALSG